MKIINLFLWTIAVTATAEPIYYAESKRSVDVRSTSPSLLLFEAPVLSVSCQPALFEFDSINKTNIRLEEHPHVEARLLEERGQKEENNHLRKMLRLTPLSKRGTSQCAFVLSNGEEIAAEFLLKEHLARPLIEFRSLARKVADMPESPNLSLLTSLLQGDPMELEKHDDNQQCRINERGHTSCKNIRFSTNLARYEIIYVGKNQQKSGWIVKAKLKRPAHFKEVADFNAPHGLLRFSLTTPQRRSYEENSEVKHHIIATANIAREELQRIFP